MDANLTHLLWSVGGAIAAGGVAIWRAFAGKKAAQLEVERARYEAERHKLERTQLILKHRSAAWSSTRLWVHAEQVEDERAAIEHFQAIIGENLQREGLDPLSKEERIDLGEWVAGEIKPLLVLRSHLKSNGKK